MQTNKVSIMQIARIAGICVLLMVIAFIAWDSQHFCKDVWFPVRCTPWSYV